MTSLSPIFSEGARPRIAIVVQGRFHAFALARELLNLGADVSVLTLYPAFIAKKFGLPSSILHTLPLLGLLHREAYRHDLPRRLPWLESFLHTTFSRWAGRVLLRHPHDLVHCFSGVALDLFHALKASGSCPYLMLTRGSAHISDQRQLLEEEEVRSGTFIDKPSSWMVERELQEYQAADSIVTLSSFARDTFLKRGFLIENLPMMPLATDTKMFRATLEQKEARCARIAEGAPLRVLGTGSFCLRKGALDFVDVARELSGIMKFTWVGNIAPDVAALAEEARDFILFLPRVPEPELPAHYHEADLYFFPTIEDGFAVTLSQAQAACLPILASRNCAAPDMIEHDKDGWLFPIRAKDEMLQYLRLAHINRASILSKVESLWQNHQKRNWNDVARGFLGFVGGY